LPAQSSGLAKRGIGPIGGFIAIAAVAGAATVLIWMFVSETKPFEYAD